MSWRWTTTLWLLALSTTSARAWEGETHGKMVDDALPKSWIDQQRYRDLRPTPFGEMVEKVFGKQPEAGPRDFRFFSSKTRKAKSDQYREQTESMTDSGLRDFARRLLLSNKLEMPFELGESPTAGVSARKILKTYAKQPDADPKRPDTGMDMVDASWHQVLMGGNNPKKMASQGFRHMLFFAGLLGDAPKRAELFFEWGRRAIEAGHPYWGFRLIAWGLHYLQDMSMPWHTKALPILRLVAMKKLLKEGLSSAVTATSNRVVNGHYPYEKLINELYCRDREIGQALSMALGNDGKDEVFDGSIAQLAKKLARSRKSAPAIARAGLKIFGKQNALDTRWRSNKEHQKLVKEVRRRLKTTHRSDLRLAQTIMIGHTRREFRRAGVATRQAIHQLGRQIGKKR